MRIYLGGYLDFYHPERGKWLDIPLQHPRPLSEVLQEAGVPLAEVQMVVMNGETLDKNELLVSGVDEVRVYSAVGGG